MTERDDVLSGGLRPPEPPPELRDRTLTAARMALAANGPDPWMRIWTSGVARFAWAASVAVLLFGHVVVGDHSSSRLSNPIISIQAGQEIQDDLAALTRLERITVSLPDRMIGAGLGEPLDGLSKESEDLS